MRTVSIEDVQKAVEKYYDIDHASLVGNKRHKGLMEARHVAIWLSRELCDRTLADIGQHFGGRSHATVMHSISVGGRGQARRQGLLRPAHADPRLDHGELVSVENPVESVWERGEKRRGRCRGDFRHGGGGVERMLSVTALAVSG